MRGVTIARQELLKPTPTLERPSHDVEPAVLLFPPFRLDLVQERLWKDERELRLRPKPFAILRFLALHPGRLVTHTEIVEEVWGKLVMSESLLRTHVRDLRRALGEPLIETVIGRGYRFLAKTSDADGVAATPFEGLRAVLDTAAMAADATTAQRSLLVQTFGSTRRRETCDVTSNMPNAEGARVLKLLAETLASLSTEATVIVIEYSPRR
jgi:DNA-binding winged helix-turn-helix (wHTH) protein